MVHTSAGRLDRLHWRVRLCRAPNSISRVPLALEVEADLGACRRHPDEFPPLLAHPVQVIFAQEGWLTYDLAVLPPGLH